MQIAEQEHGRRKNDPPVGGRFLERMKAELDLAIVTIFGVTAGVVIFGFAIFRLLTGHVLGATVDALIAFGIGANVLYAWRTEDVARAGAAFIGFAGMSCVASGLVYGGTAAYWAFLVLSVSFVATRPRPALICSAVLIIAISVQSSLFENRPEQFIFFSTASLVALFAWIFNVRYDAQRRELEALALRDPLTSAGNRRAMRHALTRSVLWSSRKRTPAVLAVLDLDHFKTINDRFGHEVGDSVLVGFADMIRGRLRKDDGFFRLGGEEFVVLLPATTLGEALPVIDVLHRRVADRMTVRGVSITVSVGVAELRLGEDWAAWLRRADEALYRAKEAGRNAVIVDGMSDALVGARPPTPATEVGL